MKLKRIAGAGLAGLLAVALLAGPAAGQTDGSAAPMRLAWTGGGLPSLSGDGQAGGDVRGDDVVQVTVREAWTHYHHATPVAASRLSFRHLMHMGGAAGCVFTARPTANGFLRAVGGGRDCPRNRGDTRCGYYSEGWDVYALAGGSCASWRVLPCGGPFCW